MKKFYTYIMINPLNNQPFYVGKGQHKRYKVHFQQAKSGKYNTDNKYKNFILKQIVESNLEPLYQLTEFSTEEEALRHEMFLIDLYGTKFDKTGILTNILKTNDFSDAFKTPVKQYTFFGEYIQTFPSVTDAVVSLGHTQSQSPSITKCCRKYKYFVTAFGFVWCYEHDEPDWDNHIYRIQFPIYQYDLNMNLIDKHISLRSAAKKLGKLYYERGIKSRVDQSSLKPYHGFIWSRDLI